jgi:hypothetical protein
MGHGSGVPVSEPDYLRHRHRLPAMFTLSGMFEGWELPYVPAARRLPASTRSTFLPG